MRFNSGLLSYWKKTGLITEKNIIDAFENTPRENFILKKHLDHAYADHPLPIGFEQTISQPTTVMLMITYLDVKKDNKVLEVGSGSGYNAAILSKLCKEVIAIERIQTLAGFSEKNLEKTGIKNVKVIVGDGSKGYKKEAPYDRIIITAACPKIPQPIIDQLKIGGIIVAPVGNLYSQEMTKLTKTTTGYKIKELGSFRFVRLIGEHGF